MSVSSVARRRLRNLRLTGRGSDSPEGVVSWHLAMQAQDYLPAKWSIAQRSRAADEASIDEAVTDGSLIRTHVLRTTWHLVARDEEGLICSGGFIGKKHGYALLDERVPPGPSFDRDAAIVELVRRYLQSHGPASLKDLSWWASLTVADLKDGVANLGSEVIREQVEGIDLLSMRSEPRSARQSLKRLAAADKDAIYKEARRLGRFLKRPVSVDFATI